MFAITEYTDATDEIAVTGRSGFGFTAVSPGVTPQDLDAIEKLFLHHPVSGFPISERIDPQSPEAHPGTILYTRHNERFYLSLGRSLGRTISSNRGGNHVTRTIMTGDPSVFSFYHPAQLFRVADIWGQQLSKKPADINLDFSLPESILPQALVTQLQADEWFSTHLPEILTMVEQVLSSNTRRLFVVTESDTKFLNFVATLNLFLDPSTSLELTFRAFPLDPAQSGMKIIGVHPLVEPQATQSWADNLRGFLVNLDTHELSAVSPSSTAQRSADWLLTNDVFDALEAISTMRSWERLSSVELAVPALEALKFQGHSPTVSADPLLEIGPYLCQEQSVDDKLDWFSEIVELLAECPSFSPQQLEKGAHFGREMIRTGSVESGTELLQLMLSRIHEPEEARAFFGEHTHWEALPILESSMSEGLAREMSRLDRPNSPVLQHTLSGYFSARKILGDFISQQTATPLQTALAHFWAENPSLSSHFPFWADNATLLDLLKNRLDEGVGERNQTILEAILSPDITSLLSLQIPRRPHELWFSAMNWKSGHSSINLAHVNEQDWQPFMEAVGVNQNLALLDEWLFTHSHITAAHAAWLVEFLQHQEAAVESSVLGRILELNIQTDLPELERCLNRFNEIENILFHYHDNRSARQIIQRMSPREIQMHSVGRLNWAWSFYPDDDLARSILETTVNDPAQSPKHDTLTLLHRENPYVLEGLLRAATRQEKNTTQLAVDVLESFMSRGKGHHLIRDIAASGGQSTVDALQNFEAGRSRVSQFRTGINQVLRGLGIRKENDY